MNTPDKTSKNNFGLNFYKRFLEIPDYYDNFKKHLPASVALYSRGFQVHDLFIKNGEIFNNPVFFQANDIIYFSPDYPKIDEFPELKKLINQWDTLVFEMDVISARPDFEGSDKFSKGLVVKRINENTISICELVVTHPGINLGDVGTEQGWHYQFADNGKLVRLITVKDCPCGNDRRHNFHMEVLKRSEYAMQEGYKQISKRLFKFSGY